MEVLKNFLKKNKGYIIISMIFIAVIVVIYFTMKSRQPSPAGIYINDITFLRMRENDSLKNANAKLEQINVEIEREKLSLQTEINNFDYKIYLLKKNYEKQITNIEDNSADSNYSILLEKLRN